MSIKKSVAVLMSVGSFVCVAHAFAAKGHGSSEMPEATVARPDVRKGPMYFYCKENTVFIENCEGRVTEPGAGCSKTFKSAQEKIENQRQITPRSAFLEELRKQITPDRVLQLKPLNSEDIKNVAEKGDLKKIENEKLKIEMTVEEAKQAVEFLKALENGDKNESYKKAMREFNALIQTIESKNANIAAVNASIDAITKALTDDVLNLVCESKNTRNLNDDDKGTLLHTVLKQYDPKAPRKEILMNGRLEKTYVDADGSGNRFKIFDTVTKLTWHDIYGPAEIKAHYEKMNPKPTFEFKRIQYPDYFAAANDLCKTKGNEYGAPTKEDLEELAKNRELAKILGMDKGWYWSSSERTSFSAWAFVRFDGGVDSYYRDVDDYSVSCVSRGAGR